MDDGDVFTLTFFAEKYREQLMMFGTKSGRDLDKVAEAGFTPVNFPVGGVGYEQAELTLVCRKIYRDDFKAENFVKFDPAQMYPENDYHRFYVGEILEVYINS
jgi:flavin reductase (DIM6/NTAB) family NADH-FMN oxidoreductase RutF